MGYPMAFAGFARTGRNFSDSWLAQDLANGTCRRIGIGGAFALVVGLGLIVACGNLYDDTKETGSKVVGSDSYVKLLMG